MKEINTMRLKAFFDKSAWLLIAVGAIGIAISDLSLLATLWQWSLYAMVAAGFAIQISRAMFPIIKLTEFTEAAKEGNLAAAIVVASIVLFCAFTFIGIVLWAK